MKSADAQLRSARRLRRSEAEEREARLAYLGTLAAGLAHEIRSPLEAMKTTAELLLEDIPGLPEETRRVFADRVERIRREAEGLKKTLDEFLAFARPPKTERFPTNLNAYLKEVLEFAQPEFERHDIRIVTDFQEDLYPVLLDQAQFTQVILNLLQNAREAIGEHGEVHILTREVGEAVEIRIEDNGGGIPGNIEDKVFEVFFTTKEHGTGLGLGIARRVVEEHEGTIRLENRPGAGTTFVVLLPKGKFLEYQSDNEAADQSERKEQCS